MDKKVIHFIFHLTYKKSKIIRDIIMKNKRYGGAYYTNQYLYK